jgi:hypothetical protein
MLWLGALAYDKSHCTFQVISAAVPSSSSAAAPPAASSPPCELLDTPAEGSGEGQTCMRRATSMGNEQPSLLGDVSLHFPFTALLSIACQSKFPCPGHHTGSTKQLAVCGSVLLQIMYSTVNLLHIVHNACNDLAVLIDSRGILQHTLAVHYTDCSFNTETTVQMKLGVVTNRVHQLCDVLLLLMFIYSQPCSD